MFYMFSILAVIGGFACIIFLILSISDSAYLPSFLSIIFSTILCIKLASMDKKINESEDEIAKLKTHLGIKDGDIVKNTNDDIANFNTDL